MPTETAEPKTVDPTLKPAKLKNVRRAANTRNGIEM